MNENEDEIQFRLARAEDEETRITSLEAEGLTRSDAQGVVDAEDMVRKRTEGFLDNEEQLPVQLPVQLLYPDGPPRSSSMRPEIFRSRI